MGCDFSGYSGQFVFFYLLVLLMIEGFLDWKCNLNVCVLAYSNGPFIVLVIEFLGAHSAKGFL